MATNTSSDWSFGGPTAPFFDAHGNDPAKFVFEQVRDDSFTLDEVVTYDDGDTRVHVPDRTLITDLASIPLFMAWFVPVNGRHTPAAVVHDKLVHDATADSDGGAGRLAASQRRSEADDLFLAAMAATGVPLLRRRIMHSAVVLATRWQRSLPARVGVLAWVLASVLGSAGLVWAVASGEWLVAALAAVAPGVGGLLWGLRSWGPAVLAGYVAWVIGLPALATALGYGAYWIAEKLLVVLPAARPRTGARPKPAP